MHAPCAQRGAHIVSNDAVSLSRSIQLKAEILHRGQGAKQKTSEELGLQTVRTAKVLMEVAN